MNTPNKEERKAPRFEDYPHLVKMEKRIKSIQFGTSEYWKERCTFLEKEIDPTYSDFERSNCRRFYNILLNKHI